MSEDSTGAPLKATLKAGTGYDDPWITVEAATPQQLATRVAGLADAGVYLEVAKASTQFAQAFGGTSAAGAISQPSQGNQDAWSQPAQQNPPQQYQNDSRGPVSQNYQQPQQGAGQVPTHRLRDNSVVSASDFVWDTQDGEWTGVNTQGRTFWAFNKSNGKGLGAGFRSNTNKDDVVWAKYLKR